MGELGILNVGAGDTKLTFDPKNPKEVERSSRIVEDMIRRGFVLLIEVGHDDKGPIYRRAQGFDPATAEYIIAGDPPAALEIPTYEQEPASPPRARGKGKAASTRRVAAASTKAVAVARTAGG